MEDHYIARLGERCALLEANTRLTDNQLKQLLGMINKTKNEHEQLRKEFDRFIKQYGDDKNGKNTTK